MAKTAPSNAQSLLSEDSQSWIGDELVLDRYWMAYVILYLMGVASLLPWNAIITPVEYLKLRVDGSAFAHSIESVLGTMFTSVSFLTLVMLQRVQNDIPLRTRILVCLFILLAIFGVLTGCAAAPLSAHDDELIDVLKHGATTQVVVIVAGSALCGIAQGVLTGSAMSYAALFARPRYLQAISGGQGIAGLAIAIGSLLFKLPSIAHDCSKTSATPGQGITPTHAREVTTSAVIYFSAVCLVIVLSIFGFLLIERLPFTRARKRLNARALSVDASPLSPLEAGAIVTSDVVPTTSTAAASDQPASADADLGAFALLAILWKWAFSIALVYTVTIAIFPGFVPFLLSAAPVNSSIGGSSSSMSFTSAAGFGGGGSGGGAGGGSGHASGDGLLGAGESGECEWKGIFVPLVFVMFNLFDTVGRNLPCIVRSANVILFCVIARVVFFPLFMLCHTAGGVGPLELPVFWGTDALPFVLTVVFAVTNGMFTSSIFVASQGVVPAKQRDAAASMLVMFLNFGIFFGAALNFVVVFLNCVPSEENGYSCNPFVGPVVNTSSAVMAGFGSAGGGSV